jgi:hypothetical protein
MAFSAGGDGGRKSPELPAQSAHAICCSQRDRLIVGAIDVVPRGLKIRRQKEEPP